MRRVLACGALTLLLAQQTGCRSSGPDARTHGAAPEHSARPVSNVRDQLLSAEQRRDSSAIGREALASRDVSVRRSAARALARIADARAAELLPLALADEDPEVSTWGAYGLGYACRGRELRTVRTLIARAASLPAAPKPAEPGPSLLNPVEAISEALGRCAGAEAEGTLRLWLSGPKARAEAAALALGRVVERDGRLEDATLVSLLDAADRVNGLQNALYPFTRIAQLNSSTGDRLLTLGLKLITHQLPGAEFAVRALVHTGDAGGAALGKLLSDGGLSGTLRAEATRELATQGPAAQRTLWAAFDTTFPQSPSDSDLSSEHYGALSALLDALQPPVLSSGAKLQSLTQLAFGDRDSASLQRRKVKVRCAAAALLAGNNDRDPRLAACDPAPESSARELATLAVLGREKLSGRRKQAYLERVSSPNRVVREAAIELLEQHAELSEAYRILADALLAKELGVLAATAHVLSGYPERAGRLAGADAHDAPKPDPSVVEALAPAYAAAGKRHSVEVQSLLLDAMGALQVLTTKDTVNGACRGDNPTLREHAERALHLLGEQTRRCDQFVPSAGTNLVATAGAGKVLLTLETEAGALTLTLDPEFAPVAVARITALAKAGFYDGVSVHRVVPGFVAQFGDPGGDGYGGDDQAPLRCETSPLPFLVGGVGVALSGRDTGSSQLFVTLGRYPHLDGQYAWLGQAGPGWDRVAAGDRILHVRVSAAP